jgi:hypothetical protein
MSADTETRPTNTTTTTTQDPKRPRTTLPGPREVLTAARDTRLLLTLRWRFVRSNRSRLFIGLGFATFLAALFLASQIGTLIRRYAEQGVETAAGQFAVNYVIALNRGELGVIGASAVGSVVLVALFTPFTGATMQPLASSDDLSGLRPTRVHRFFDSIITNAASAIGFLQLVTLTGIGSLLTLDGGRPGGLIFIWSVWPALLLLSVCTGWGIELVARAYGAKARRALAAGALAVIGAAICLDPNHGKTLFGIGGQVAATLEAAADNNLALVGRNLAIVATLAVTFFILGLYFCRAALALPAPTPANSTTGRRLIPMSTNPTLALAQLLVAQIIRSPEVRRPLLTVMFLGLPAVWISHQFNVMSTLVVAIPLAVALAFGINIFGILGPAMPWLASQPNLMRRLLLIAVLVQVGTTLLLAFLIWTPAALAGRIDLGDLAAVAAGTVTSTVLTARSAAHKAVHRPFLVRLGTRGDMIVPPLTAINYTLRFALWSGQIGVLVMTRDTLLQVLLVVFAIAWSALRLAHLLRTWSNRDVQAFVTKQVSAS